MQVYMNGWIEYMVYSWSKKIHHEILSCTAVVFKDLHNPGIRMAPKIFV